MTTLKTLLPRKPRVDLPPVLHRFLQEWKRQLLKSDKPPHREVAKVLKLKDSTVSTYKLRLIDLGVLVKIGPCRYKVSGDLVVNLVGQPKMKLKNGVLKEFVVEFDLQEQDLRRPPTQVEMADHLGVSRQWIGQLVGLATRLGYLHVMRTGKRII